MAKFLLLSSHFLPNDGGIARLMTELSYRFENNKQDYTVLLLENEEVKPSPSIFQIRLPRILKEIYAVWRVKRHKDIIISSLWYPDGWIADFSSAKKKVILVHGSELLKKQNKFKEYFFKKIRQKTLNNADLLVANSQFTADFIRQNFKPKKVVVINPGTDIKRFSPAGNNNSNRYHQKNKFILSTLSVIRRHKGLEILLEAIAGLPIEIRENIKLNVGGKGDAQKYYYALSERLKINDCVNWCGFIPENDLPDFYRASNLFLLTSQLKANAFEGFGMVLTEAQACGVPVLGTRSGGIVDAVKEGKGGFLIEEGDAAALKEIVIRIYNSVELQQNMGKAARKRILREFSWEIYYQKLINSIQDL